MHSRLCVQTVSLFSLFSITRSRCFSFTIRFSCPVSHVSVISVQAATADIAPSFCAKLGYFLRSACSCVLPATISATEFRDHGAASLLHRFARPLAMTDAKRCWRWFKANWMSIRALATFSALWCVCAMREQCLCLGLGLGFWFGFEIFVFARGLPAVTDCFSRDANLC
jgi:hypothetical protein